jgi:P3 major capsid protein
MPQATAAPPTSAAQAAQNAAAANQLANQIIRAQAIEMYTPLAPVSLSNTVNNAGQVVNVTPRNVGLLKGFYVEYSAQIKNTNASAAITPTGLGPVNLFTNIQFTDLQNNVRINCPAYQIHLLNTLKQKNPFATAFLGTTIDSPVAYGQNSKATVQGATNTDTLWSATSSIAAANGTGVVTGVLWIPIAYSDHDYRGCIYANVVNGQMNLQFTINPTPAYVSGGAQMMAMYGPADSATSVQVLNTQITVSQVYMDQLPIDPRSGLPILPQKDIATIYELKNTTFTGAVPSNDFPMQYPNFRDILSSTVLMDNLGTVPSVPSVVNYFSLQAANSTNIFRRSPSLNQALVRNIMGFDLPTGITYFSYRGKPLSTTQYGNLQLIVNPAASWNTTYAIYHCWESFASIATITQAGSLAAS